MDEMKEEVEPLPLVPAICIRFSLSKAEGWYVTVSYITLLRPSTYRPAHLIIYPPYPTPHLRQRALVPSWSLLPDRLYRGEVALK